MIEHLARYPTILYNISQMIALYKDPKGEKVFNKYETPSFKSQQQTESTTGTTDSALKLRIQELEKQVLISVLQITNIQCFKAREHYGIIYWNLAYHFHETFPTCDPNYGQIKITTFMASFIVLLQGMLWVKKIHLV